MMGVVKPETCWAYKKYSKIISDIKLVFYSSVITMLHGPTNSFILQLPFLLFIHPVLWHCTRSYLIFLEDWHKTLPCNGLFVKEWAVDKQFWWKDTGRRKPSTRRIKLSQRHFSHHMWHRDVRHFEGNLSQTALRYRSKLVLFVHYFAFISHQWAAQSV